MEKVESSPTTVARYEELGEQLGARGVEVGKMFGMPILKPKGKASAGLYGDAMTFKLPEPSYGHAMTLKGAAQFDPSGMGRPMKEWVVVPVVHAKSWAELAEAARTYVSG